MIARTLSGGTAGIDSYLVEVEADISNGIPAFDIVGLPDLAVKESKERVRAAMKNCGLQFPAKRLTVNLAPANLKKEGPAYDLPITVALLIASKQVEHEAAKDSIFFGELSLDGHVRTVYGILPMVLMAKEMNVSNVYVPVDNAMEAAVVEGVNILPVENLHQLYKHLKREYTIQPLKIDIGSIFSNSRKYDADFSEVKGQDEAKRAAEVAIAGGHNILFIGSPGSGKSMIAKRIPTILPDLEFSEALEVTKIHSIAGTLPAKVSLITTRPFRSPHHTISAAGLAGGGTFPKPGELSLSHHGVLFMDEMPEFHKDVLEVMRQPMEDGTVTISRVQGSITYPCNTLLVGAMNPCKCGYWGERDRVCTCTPPAITKYRGKISGPLMDRIDIHINVSAMNYDGLTSDSLSECSQEIKKRVTAARCIQLERYRGDGIYTNSQLTPRLIDMYCKLDEESDYMLGMAFERLKLSARAHSRILKVARTIADLAGSENIKRHHIAEAIQYRSLDRGVC